MSITRNRELSQFGSFIYIDNNSQEIGIATETTPYVGIGTANPSVKFEVIGDTNIGGNLTVSEGIEASSYTINGNPLVDATILQWNYASNTTDIYRLNGNVGIGTSVFAQKLTVIGNISAGQFISTVTSGTAPFVVLSDTQVTNLNASFLRGKTPPSGTIVGTTDTQTLTNKTLTSPIINGVSFSSSGITLAGSTSGTTNLQASAVASGVLTLPAATTTLVGRNTTDTLTNKTIAAGSNTITGLTNTNLSGSAGITNANLANSTISGVALGSTLNALTFGSYLTSTGTYNGSTARTVSVAGTSVNTTNTLVARNDNGDFTAGTINASTFNATTSDAFRISGTTVIDNTRSLVNIVDGTFSGTVTATDFNSTSDLNIKENISTFENGLETIQQLRGVNYTWKENGKSSIGVIAQELEQILPQLVKDGEVKSVNYNGLIGVLIEAVKELSAEVEELKKKVL
jgi:hypothetical protein